jgi:hypothetical protein
VTSLREQLLEIRRTRGVLTGQVVVEEARDEGHPLHSRFEWDDAIAGEKWRVEQANELIRSVRVNYTSNGKSSDLRGFVSISRPDTPAREYLPVEEVAEDPLMRKLVLRDAEREWRELLSRYEHLQEFFDIVRKDVA